MNISTTSLLYACESVFAYSTPDSMRQLPLSSTSDPLKSVCSDGYCGPSLPRPRSAKPATLIYLTGISSVKRGKRHAVVRSATDSASTSSSSSSALLDPIASPQGSLYDLLGISQNVSRATIKDAYRQLARRYHPDVRPQEVSEEESVRRFIEVQEAYEILSDPQRRAMYDFELVHPASRSRRRMDVSGMGHAPWRRNSKGRGEGPTWSSPDDLAQIRSQWRGQWRSQLNELSRRGNAKPFSWASRMRQQQDREPEKEEEHGVETESAHGCSESTSR